jgi:hypothetical protein
MREWLEALVYLGILVGIGYAIRSMAVSALRSEREWQVKDRAERAALGIEPPSSKRRAGAQLASLAAVIGAVILGAAYGLNLLQIAAIAAVPVLLARRWRSYRRTQDAANTERFGSYTPSFRDRP